jgi:hypothetical protein
MVNGVVEVINNLINTGMGCPGCGFDAVTLANIKPDDVMIASFFGF